MGYFALVFIGVAVMAHAAYAQSSGRENYDSQGFYVRTLQDYNRLKPYQNPRWIRFDLVRNNTIVDNQNRVMGVVRDIFVTDHGVVHTLDADLSRMQMGRVSLDHVALGVRAGSGSYILSVSSHDFRMRHGQSTSNIDVDTTIADTRGDTEIMRVSSIIGAYVESYGKQRLGRVDQLMFTARYDRADSLVVRLERRDTRTGLLAIPFQSLRYEMVGTMAIIRIPDDLFEAILLYAAKR